MKKESIHKTNYKPLVITIIILLIITSVIGIFFTVKYGLGLLQQPRFILVYENSADGLQGFDYFTYVTCGVKNVGNGDGNAIITAVLTGGGIGYEQQTQTTYLKPDQTRNIKFTFDTSLFSSSARYSCSVKKA